MRLQVVFGVLLGLHQIECGSSQDLGPFSELRDRLKNFKIFGLTRFEKELLYDDNGKNLYLQDVIKIVTPATKSFTSIQIWIPGSYLTLCEVEVYGVPGCEPPTLASHVRISSPPDKYSNGTSISLICTTGYTSLENGTIICSENLTWSGVQPTCSPVHCHSPEVLENGYYLVSNENECASNNLTNLYYLCEIKAYCNVGYRLHNQSKITCRENGQWTTPYPICNIVTCKFPAEFSYGKYIYYIPSYIIFPSKSLYYGTNITIQCEKGYKMHGRTERMCTSNGTWSGEQPKCSIVQCSVEDLVTVGHGHYILNIQNKSNIGAANYLETAELVCEKGFKVESKSNSTCTADGTWSSLEASCKIVTCLIPRETQYIKFRTWYNESFGEFRTELPFGAYIEVDCQPGILKSGSRVRNCTEDGSWDGDEAVCVSLCRVPEKNNSMFRDINNRLLDVYEEGQNLSFTCNEGYTSATYQKYITCQKNHSWTFLPECLQLPDNISTEDSSLAVIIGLSCGLVICAVAAIAAVLAFILYFLRGKRKKRQEEDLYTRLHIQQASNVENDYAKIQETTVK